MLNWQLAADGLCQFCRVLYTIYMYCEPSCFYTLCCLAPIITFFFSHPGSNRHSQAEARVWPPEFPGWLHCTETSSTETEARHTVIQHSTFYWSDFWEVCHGNCCIACASTLCLSLYCLISLLSNLLIDCWSMRNATMVIDVRNETT